MAMGRKRSLLDLATMGGHVGQYRYLLAVLDSQAQISRSMLISAASASNEQAAKAIIDRLLDSGLWDPESVCDD
jgi:hypothetical protein